MINVKSLVSCWHFPSFMSLGRLIYDFLSEDNQCFRQINYSIKSKASCLGWLYTNGLIPFKREPDKDTGDHSINHSHIQRWCWALVHFPYWKYTQLHFRPCGKWGDFIPNHTDGTSECSKMQTPHSCKSPSVCIDCIFPSQESFWTSCHVVCVDVKDWAIHTVAKWFSYW